jgi:tryptophanyl-tRNA synthetase
MNRILTGIRPTGALHLGHYVGALKNWVNLQNDYECYFLVADAQALTTHADRPELIQDAVKDVVLDFLAVGLDPKKENVNFVLQSAIPELHEITAYLSMVTPFNWMQSNPTIQTESKGLKTISVGFMNYPVSQAADILFASPNPVEVPDNYKILVPVGDDQVPHLRDANSICGAFNRTYKSKVFVECDALVGEIGRLVGTDGQSKMSKSSGNCIQLKDDADTVSKQIMSMYTDPNRIHPTDPGTVEGNPIFIYHDAFNENKEQVEDFKKKYREGTIGDVEVKKVLAEVVNEFLEPIRERRSHFTEKDISDFLKDGTQKARVIAQNTLKRVKNAMKIDYTWMS